MSTFTIEHVGSYDLPVSGHLRRCEPCGRRILILNGLIGVNHSIPAGAYCWDCITPEVQAKCVEKYGLKVE